MTLFLTTIISTPVMAEVRDGAFSLSLFEGGYTFDGAQHLETALTHGARLGYNITSNWGVEGSFNYAQLESTNSRKNTEGELYNYSGNILYNFSPQNRVVPYVTLGGGISRTSHFSGTWNTDGTVNYGLGLNYSLTDTIALRGDARQIFSFHPPKYGGGDFWSNYEYTAGMTFQFGGTPTAAPVVAAGKPEKSTEALQPEPQKMQQPDPQPLLAAKPAVAVSTNTTKAEAAPPVTKQAPAVVVPALPQEPKVAAVANGCKNIEVRQVLTLKNGIEIVTDIPIESYTTLILSHPTRLAVDICAGTNGTNDSKSQRYHVNLKKICNVRVGSHMGKKRIVFDSPLAKFPDYQIEKTARGFKLILKQN